MFFRLRYLTFAMLLCLILESPVVTAYEDSHAPDDATTAINFQAQILPILKRRCLECHNSEVTEAGLNLESRSLAESGGHTGNTILGNDPKQSELIQRIISDDESYRMPRDARPLSAAEIEVLRAWVIQGADWPDVLAVGESSLQGSITRYFRRFFDPLWTALERDGKYLHFLGFPLVAFLLFFVISERIKKSKAKRQSEIPIDERAAPPKGLDRIGRVHYFAGLLVFAILGLGLFHLGAIMNTNARIEQLELELADLHGERATGPQALADGRPQPPRRRHPIRLGGIYYRGNDERSPKLYNGGYYRTADLEVWLSDSNGHRLEWDDPIGGETLFITMQISRAPVATSALFTPRVINTIFMSRQVPNEDAVELKDSPVGFIPIEDGQRFIAHYPITETAVSSNDNIRGMVYVYQGKLDGSRVSGKIHYGIEYDILVPDGRVSSESQVWMGSIFNLGKGLVIPADDRIALCEWFDFRPIPAIIGENTDDPKLLGIPEHVPGDY